MNTLTLVYADQRDAVVSFPPSDPATQSLSGFRQGLVESFTALLTPHPVNT